MYLIKDLQIPGRGFADGVEFKNNREVVEQLASYHDIDFTGTDEMNNELSIDEYFKFWKIDTTQKQLDWLLEYGEWEIKKIKSEKINAYDLCIELWEAIENDELKNKFFKLREKIRKLKKEK